MQNIEIERKWLMEGFPNLPHESEEWMEQGYLTFEPAVRIRKTCKQKETNHWLTIKGGDGLCRTEVELPLDEAQYEALQKLLAAPTAKKRLRRYRLATGEELECSAVDETEPSAFFYAEVEFATVEEANAFSPPDFLGREVTNEAGQSMSAYCRKKAGLR